MPAGYSFNISCMKFPWTERFEKESPDQTAEMRRLKYFHFPVTTFQSVKSGDVYQGGESRDILSIFGQNI